MPQPSQTSNVSLDLHFGNPSAQPSWPIYITTDPSINHPELEITTNTDGVVFTHGTPVPEAQAPGAHNSLIYLNLSALQLSAGELTALAVAPPGWLAVAYPNDGMICLTPKDADVALNSLPPLRLKLGQLTLANPPQGATVAISIAVYHVARFTVGAFGRIVSSKSTLLSPPGNAADLHDAIALTVRPESVTCTPAGHADVSNQLKLFLSPGPNPRSIPAGPGTVFSLTFVYADPTKDPDGYGALTDPVTAQQDISVKLEQGATAWKNPGASSKQDPAWPLTPPPGDPIVPVDGVVEFDVTGIVTRFQPGPTLLILSYSGVPGYAPGAYTCVIEKRPLKVGPPRVTKFYAVPEVLNYRDSVTLEWETVNATGAELLIGETGRQQLGPAPDPNHPFKLTPQYGVSYNLRAFNSQGATSLPVPLMLTFNPVNIVSFTWPPSVNPGGPINLTWDVLSCANLQLNIKDESGQLPTGSAQYQAPASGGGSVGFVLQATGPDGSYARQIANITINAVAVDEQQFDVKFAVDDSAVTVDITIAAEHATSASVSNAHLVFSDNRCFYSDGAHTYSTPPTGIGAQLQAVDNTHWHGSLEIPDIPAHVLAYPYATLIWDYDVEGNLPRKAPYHQTAWRGDLQFSTAGHDH